MAYQRGTGDYVLCLAARKMASIIPSLSRARRGDDLLGLLIPNSLTTFKY
jgi:hypothetical protein